jgi:hypothetical protein
MMKSIDAIRKQEKVLSETLLVKTTDLLNKVLIYVPSNTVLVVNDITVKVIRGSDGKKSLLINNRPLSSSGDCEWVIENISDLTQAVDQLMNPEVEEMLKVIEKTEALIKRVDDLTRDG